MFQNYSMRARQVVFATRAKGGERGADELDVGDLVIGIILEDQRKIGTVLSGVLGVDSGEESMQMFEPHHAFFSAESASDLLAGVEGLLPKSTPIPSADDMPASADLARIFELTEKLRDDLHHNEIQPLHLLAVILGDGPNQFAEIFRRVGITQETVLAKLNDPKP
jgi:hypothetical protein